MAALWSEYWRAAARSNQPVAACGLERIARA